MLTDKTNWIELEADTCAAILDSVERFAHQRLAPASRAIDDNGVFPVDLYREFASLGTLALLVPEHDGGLGPELSVAFNASFRLARENLAFAIAVSNCADCLAAIVQGGSKSVRERTIPGIISGEIVPAFCLSEASGGSDVAAMRATAERDGDHYILNGSKAWITSAPVAGLFVVFAKTDLNAGSRGITTFLVDRDATGLQVGEAEDLLCLRGSPTASVHFNNVRVPVGNRLGDEGAGFLLAMRAMDEARINIAACAIGAATQAVETAIDYARQRIQFGKPIIEHQALGFTLADLVNELAAVRATVTEAARTVIANPHTRRATMHASFAKLTASDFAMKAAIQSAQILGANGLTKAYPIERLIRDCKGLQIFEGTNEIQKAIILRELQRDGFIASGLTDPII